MALSSKQIVLTSYESPRVVASDRQFAPTLPSFRLVCVLRNPLWLPPTEARAVGRDKAQCEGQRLQFPEFRQHRAPLGPGLLRLKPVAELRVVCPPPDSFGFPRAVVTANGHVVRGWVPAPGAGRFAPGGAAGRSTRKNDGQRHGCSCSSLRGERFIFREARAVRAKNCPLTSRS